MRWIVRLVVLGFAVCSVGVMAQQNEAPSTVPVCVHWAKEARYGAYAYNHIVRIQNGCKRSVACTITTSTNPASAHVVVESGEEKEVLTFRGSPAREFTADVRCAER